MFDNVSKAGSKARFGKDVMGKKMGMLKSKMGEMKKSRPSMPKVPSAPTLPEKASDTARQSIMKRFTKSAK